MGLQKKSYLPSAIAALITIVVFVVTSKELVGTENPLNDCGLISYLIVITFLSWIGSGLWVSFLAVIIIVPVELFIHGMEQSLWILSLYVFVFILAWIQCFIFGICIPFAFDFIP